MRSSMNWFLAFNLASACLALTTQEPKRLEARWWPRQDLDKAAEIKKAFREAWDVYYKNAFPHDSVMSLDWAYVWEDDLNGWGATAVDSLSTALVMDEDDIAKQMVDHIIKVDFSTTPYGWVRVNVLQTTIRYLGGILSGYDLLKGPKKDIGIASWKVDKLLQQAEVLADSLSVAFNTSYGCPYPRIILNPDRRRDPEMHTSLADVGTLVLEWTHLSDLTGNKKWAEIAQKAQGYLLNPTGAKPAFPGLLGNKVSAWTCQILDATGGWGAGGDGYYEYLMKMYLYDNEKFADYKDHWVQAADSTIRHLASRPITRPDMKFLMQFESNRWGDSKRLPISSHFAGSAGASFILGGILLDDEKYKKFGLLLAESYYQTYHMSSAGLGPENFRWVASEIARNNIDNLLPKEKQQISRYSINGFWATDPKYELRPHVIESLYYAYRVGGKEKFQNMAWEIFQAIKKNCRVKEGYAPVDDINKPDGGAKLHYHMESFMMAQTFKYLYLIFAPHSDLQVAYYRRDNFYVYNKGGHPLKVRKVFTRNRG